MKPVSVLILEDEKMIRESLRRRLEREGLEVSEAPTGQAARELLSSHDFEVVLLDYRLPDVDGITMLREIKQQAPATVAIMVTAFSTVNIAIEALRLGAADFVTKPFNLDEMVVCIQRAIETQHLRDEVRRLHSVAALDHSLDSIIGQSPVMRRLKELIRNVAASPATTVLLEGESGTGKDFVAKAIHYSSPRSENAFVNITCTAITGSLLESELFGHEKGAFTDAREQKKGLFEVGDGGTIFLDEIGDMPLALQAKLLRFLEERAFRRVGGTHDIRVDVRVISATNRNIRELIARGQFRADLYYRLNSLMIVMPPLKDRKDDIPLLAEHFVDQMNRSLRKDVRRISDDAMQRLVAYDWPGNVRELRNVIERAMLLGGSRGEIQEADLTLESLAGPADTPLGGSASTTAPPSLEAASLLGEEGVDLQELERRLVAEAFERTGGNQTQAARLLHLSRDQFRYRLEKFGLLGSRTRGREASS